MIQESCKAAVFGDHVCAGMDRCIIVIGIWAETAGTHAVTIAVLVDARERAMAETVDGAGRG